MKKLFFALVFSSMLFVFYVPQVASAHTQLHVNCYNDQCDGYWPHDTDGSGGSNCLSGFQDAVPSIALKDRDGLTEGTMHFYQSYQCDAVWATVHADTTYMTEIDIYTYRLHQSWPTLGDDDRSLGPHVVTWPNYLTGWWLDNAMAGFETYDVNVDNDCLHGRVRWEDRYYTWHDINSQEWCV